MEWFAYIIKRQSYFAISWGFYFHPLNLAKIKHSRKFPNFTVSNFQSKGWCWGLCFLKIFFHIEGIVMGISKGNWILIVFFNRNECTCINDNRSLSGCWSTCTWTHLSRMEFPTHINWTSPFPFKRLVVGNFHCTLFNGTFCKQTAKTFKNTRRSVCNCFMAKFDGVNLNNVPSQGTVKHHHSEQWTINSC